MAEAAKTPVVDVEKTLSFPVGAFSPLWLAFAGAAATGAAFFWMSRWARPVNIEAQLAAELPSLPPAPEAVAPPAAPIAIVEKVAEAAVAAFDAEAEIVQTATETVLEAVIERSAALVEALDPVDPVVGDAPVEAPVEKAVEAVEAAVEEQAEAAAEIVEAVAEAAPVVADDLTRLVGIGPKLAVSLAERGVTTFAQLAAWTSKDLAEVDLALSLKGRAVRDAWVAQARRFAEAAS